MKIDNNKERGNAGLSLAIAYYGCNGYTVSLPLNDTQDYDLIVDKDNKLYKIQVKFSSYTTKSGAYQVSLKSSGGTKGTIYKTVKDTNIDFLFVVCADKTMYEIPIDEISNFSSIALKENNNYFKYKVEI